MNETLAEFIRANLGILREQTRTGFPDLWEEHFRTTPSRDSFKLLFAAGFTLNVGGHTLWTDIKIPEFAEPPLENTIRMAFTDPGLFLLTHHHSDHFDTHVMKQAIVNPDVHLAAHANRFPALEEAGVSRSGMIPVLPNGEFTFEDLTIEIIATPHLNIEDSVAYFIKSPQSPSVLILGDIREYKADFARALPQPDVLLFNVWLGRRQALEFNTEYIQAAAEFICALNPGVTFLLHLYELSRAAEDVWTYAHAGLLKERCMVLDPRARFIIPVPNHPYPLAP